MWSLFESDVVDEMVKELQERKTARANYKRRRPHTQWFFAEHRRISVEKELFKYPIA